MLECIQTFENYLNTEIAKGKGSAIVDMSRVLGNLTSVRHSPTPTPAFHLTNNRM